MSIKQLVQFGQKRVARRMLRAAPWLGGMLALATLGTAIRRKGTVRGTVDTALDFTPIVGGIKNVAEALRGRDFISDRRNTRLSRRTGWARSVGFVQDDAS
jgi:hypothetical protein